MNIINPYDLIIIRPNVIPDKDIEELMLLTNDKEVRQATIINNNDDGTQTQKENLKNYRPVTKAFINI